MLQAVLVEVFLRTDVQSDYVVPIYSLLANRHQVVVKNVPVDEFYWESLLL